MSSIEKQIEGFVSGTTSEYAFPAGLSVEERKLVKSSAEKLGLSSRSFGMGIDRQIHIFKPASSTTHVGQPIRYSVKNTFVDGPLDASESQEAGVGPAFQSMPVGSLQEHLAVEEGSFAATSLVKGNGSSRNSEVDTGSTVDSDSEAFCPPIPIKNSFVHFDDDSAENADPRIVQSMPAGTFAQNIEEEKAGTAKTANRKGKPLPLSEDIETQTSSAMLFPCTPNAENQIMFDARHLEAVSVAQWIPLTMAAPEQSSTDCSPAFCAPSAPVQTLLNAESTPVAESPPVAVGPQGLPQGPSPGVPQGLPQAQPMPPQAPPQTSFGPGTPVVLQNLANQPGFNGLRGVVSGFDADCERYNVMIEIGPHAARRLVKVKANNLVAQPLLPPQCSPVQQSVVMSRPAKASLVLDQMV